MREEIEATEEMTETLRSAGFEEDQSKAFIRSMARAVETFAVTPEMLDRKFREFFDKIKPELRQIPVLTADVQELKNLYAHQQESIKQLQESQQDIKEILADMRTGQWRHFATTLLVLIAGLFGIIAAIIVD